MITQHLYRVGGMDSIPQLQGIIESIKATPSWQQKSVSGVLGSAHSCTVRTKYISGTGSNFLNMKLDDVWADLGDGVRHKIVCIHSATLMETENYIDSVPGTISLTFWKPIRKTLFVEGEHYTDAMRFDTTPMCLSVVGDGGAYLTNTHKQTITSDTDPNWLAVTDANSMDAGAFNYGSITLDDIHVCNHNQGIYSVFDGTVITKAYEDDVGGIVNGRIHFYCFDMTLESTFKHTGLSIWHAGTQLEMCSSFIAAEQTIEHIAADRGVVLDCICVSTKTIDGHYACGVLFDVQWENSTTDTYKGGATTIGSYMECANCLNNNWETSTALGNVGLLFASSELDSARTNPNALVKSIGNIFSIDIPNASSYGQALRVANYNTAGTAANMKLYSYYDTFFNSGDVTNYHDAYADRGVINLYHPYKTPMTTSVNGGTVVHATP